MVTDEANSPSIIEGVPVGRGSNIGIENPYNQTMVVSKWR
jgi:hypothetical protein